MEIAAKRVGLPTTPAQRERIQSCRESSVTRKRVELYRGELETALRALPSLYRERCVLRKLFAKASN